jgi:hypothetical protein
MTHNLYNILLLPSGLSILSISSISMMGIDGSYTQTIKTESTLSSSTIHITKDA